MRRARSGDIPLLVDLMTDFYSESGYALDRPRAVAAFSELLADSRLGCVWIIQSEQHDVGHVVLTMRYAMEFGGIVGCLDDLFVRPAWRNLGLASSAMSEVKRYCEQTGIRALTVEVAPDNGPAQAVYRRSGFALAHDRHLLVLPLAAPAHNLP